MYDASHDPARRTNFMVMNGKNVLKMNLTLLFIFSFSLLTNYLYLLIILTYELVYNIYVAFTYIKRLLSRSIEDTQLKNNCFKK